MIFALDAAIFALMMLWLMLIARIALSWIFAFARDWRPAGVSALLVESVFTVTDPLIKPLRRLIPPITIGPMRLDVAFFIVFFAVFVLRQLLMTVSADLR